MAAQRRDSSPWSKQGDPKDCFMNEYREVEQRVSMGFTNYPHSGYRNYLPEKHGIFLEMHYV